MIGVKARRFFVKLFNMLDLAYTVVRDLFISFSGLQAKTCLRKILYWGIAHNFWKSVTTCVKAK